MENGDTVPQPLSYKNDWAPYYFHQGANSRAFDYLGVHRLSDSFVFRVWAPHANEVLLCGDFTDWTKKPLPMQKITENGVWEVFVPATRVKLGQNYKYLIRNGQRELMKADPYAFSMQKPPETASVVCDINGYEWRDEGWMRYRSTRFTRRSAHRQPINVYELHAGSWKRHTDGSLYSYKDLAAELFPYVKQMGYTHVELLPIAEHPNDHSWGYDICGYYAPTARYGSPTELMRFVDAAHEAGIGVILDWVPAHFPKDEHGLYEFDGQPLYEYQDRNRRENPVWGSRCFDVGRREVQSFLISNAVFWADKYHVDGLRVDGVASMLYLDYDRRNGEWTPNVHGGNESLEAIAFFQKLNACMAREYPDVMTIAVEPTAWPYITEFEHNGLGFTFKWNIGWMNESLAYMREDPLWRKHHHNKLTYPVTYAFNEHYALPVSHDEVVYGKKSLLDRMPGTYEQKFAGLRCFLTYMMTYPGKKLLFAGSEFGQFGEWDHTDQTDWFLLDYPMHAKMQLFTARLNTLYLRHPALWEKDGSWDGFCWIDADNREQSIYSYRRIDDHGRELIVLLNFLPVRRNGFLLPVPHDGVYEEIFNTDDSRFGGSGLFNEGQFRTEPCTSRNYTRAIRVNVPPMSAMLFRCVRKAPPKNK